MPRPCGHRASSPGCTQCHWWDHTGPEGSLFRARFGEPDPPAMLLPNGQPIPRGQPRSSPMPLVLAPSKAPCKHLGEETGERIECPVCNGRVQLKLFQCDLHGECTLERKAPGKAVCAVNFDAAQSCPDREPDFVRNLLYYIYPRRGSIWRQNTLWLLERIALFNGKRVVAIATDGTTETADHVKDALAGQRVEYIELTNNPNLREVAAFPALWESVASTDPRQVTLFAQGKGVTRDINATGQRWAKALYEVYMDHWPLVAGHLARFPVTGAFKKHGMGWRPDESMSQWHYSGSWVWFRNADVFAGNWQQIDRFWSGVEPWASLHFHDSQAGCLFHEGPVPHVNLYSVDYWNRVIDPALAAWKAANAGKYLRVPYEVANVPNVPA